MKSLRSFLFGLAAAVAVAGPAAAVTDPAGDFLATFTGAHSGDLDILATTAAFDGTNFVLSATVNGAIGASTGALYIWGIDRGAGTERLTLGTPSVGAGIKWDAVAVLFPDGTARAVSFPAMGPPAIIPLFGAVTVSGDTISGVIPLSGLPSRGFAPEDYTFALWTRLRTNPAVDGPNTELADFAPDVSSFKAAVPEPATWALMFGGFGLAGAALRRRWRWRTEPGRSNPHWLHR